MIISRTPFRISFFGGGTDYPGWYRKNGGRVLATTINRYCYINARFMPPFFGYKYRIVYNSKIENCKTIDEILHPSVRESIRFLKINLGLDVHYNGDLPGRSGLGSSSAFTVGLLHAFYALQGKMVSKYKLVKDSIYLEQEILKETVGSQDQVSVSYGGFNIITFHKDGEITLKPITISPNRLEELQNHLMLFYTGIERTASDIARSYVNNIEDRQKELERMQDFVSEALELLSSEKDIKYFGELLNKAWQIKRSFSSVVSNSRIDSLYKKALSAGALGGKLLGAGGGGFILLFVSPSYQLEMIKQLKNLIHVPFKFENEGSKIIFYDNQDDYSTVKQ